MQKLKRVAFVQYAEFLLLKRMHESRIEFLIVGGTAAHAYGLEVVPKDLSTKLPQTHGVFCGARSDGRDQEAGTFWSPVRTGVEY